MWQKIWKWVKIGIFAVGLFTICDYLFDYNQGKITMNVKEIVTTMFN